MCSNSLDRHRNNGGVDVKMRRTIDLKDPDVREELAERIIMQEYSQHIRYTAIAFLFAVIGSIIYFLWGGW